MRLGGEKLNDPCRLGLLGYILEHHKDGLIGISPGLGTYPAELSLTNVNETLVDGTPQFTKRNMALLYRVARCPTEYSV